MLTQEVIPDLVQERLLAVHSAQRLRWLGGGGGMSGARLWRVQSKKGPLCLRRWPQEHPSPSRLTEVHRCMDQARSEGCLFVPELHRTSTGASFLEADGYLWELTQWLPGVADYWEAPSLARLKNAAHALARLHRAWLRLPEYSPPDASDSVELQFPEGAYITREILRDDEPSTIDRSDSGAEESKAARGGLTERRVRLILPEDMEDSDLLLPTSNANTAREPTADADVNQSNERSASLLFPPVKHAPAVLDRLARLEQLEEEYCARLKSGLLQFDRADWFQDAASILASVVELRSMLMTQLRPFADELFPCQYVLRDIWHDHVLFKGEVVSGVVDYGAVRVDTVATDLARMIASLTGRAPDGQWEEAISVYKETRPISTMEERLIPVLYRSSALLSGLQWIQWLCVEQRVFPGNEAFIRRRLSTLAVAVREMLPLAR